MANKSASTRQKATEREPTRSELPARGSGPKAPPPRAEPRGRAAPSAERPAPPRPPPARATPRLATRSPELEAPPDGPEHREFPRARFTVPVHLWIGEEPALRFSATLPSVNLSVSGVFLESTFFVPHGTRLEIRFELGEGAEPVHARAQVVRSEHPDPRTGEGRSGMGLRFEEFFGQTEVGLARLFLGARLQRFAEGYLQSRRARSLASELDRVIDALAAWELLKVTHPEDPWTGEA